jgi:hypothetical protein
MVAGSARTSFCTSAGEICGGNGFSVNIALVILDALQGDNGWKIAFPRQACKPMANTMAGFDPAR